MSVERPTQDADRRGLSRRQIAVGAAWAVPVVVTTAPAPVYAASFCVNQCYTLDWDNAGQGFLGDAVGLDPNVDWTRTGYVAPTAPCTKYLNVTVAQQRTGGMYQPGVYQASTRTDTAGDFSIGRNIDSATQVPAAQPGLVLYQSNIIGYSSTESETVTFTFDRPIQTVTFTIYDVTRQGTGTSYSNINDYQDRVAFNVAGTVTKQGDTVPTASNLVSTRNPTAAASQSTFGDITNFINRSSEYLTTSTDRSVGVSLTLAGASSFQMIYAGLAPYGTGTTGSRRNRQYVVIGDLTVCT